MITQVFILQLVQSLGLTGLDLLVYLDLPVCQHRQGKRGKEKGVTTYI
jgi:hypothetical protein